MKFCDVCGQEPAVGHDMRFHRIENRLRALETDGDETLWALAKVVFVCPNCSTDLVSVTGVSADGLTVKCRECGTWSRKGTLDD